MFNLKHSGQLVCKLASLRLLVTACLAIVLNFAIATLFAVLFVACSLGGSTEETSMGGSSEEPSIASLENVSVKGLAMVSARLEPLDTSKPEIDLSLNGMQKGSIVILYELDSVSLERTGVSYTDTIDNDDGLFNIQHMNLKSPYVWITAIEKKGLSMKVEYMDDSFDGLFRVNAFVNVRDTTPVTVDVFSSLIASRARVLMLAGNDYDAARAQAKREILEAFGIYDSAENLDESGVEYYAIQSVLVAVLGSENSVDDVVISDSLVKSFGRTGSFSSDSEVILYGVDRLIDNLIFRLAIPQKVYDRMGAGVAREYQAMLLYEKYLAGMLSVVHDAGRCTPELEGTTVIVSDGYGRILDVKFNIVCRSERWHLAYDQIPHTFDTLMDARDGKVYKTVTFDLGGQTQTWMAENLKYNGARTSCYNDDEQNCDIYGRQYDWQIAMGLGDSILSCEFESMQECVDSLSHQYFTAPRSYDSVFVAKCIAKLENPNPKDIEKCKYYGGATPSIDYDSLQIAYNLEIQERCEKALNGRAMYVDLNKVNLDSLAITQGVCPEGWRIPNFDDWKLLFDFIQRELHSCKASSLLAAPSIGDPFGFNLYNMVDMEWDGNRSLKVEKVWSDYIMISKSDDRDRARTGFFKLNEAMNASYSFNNEDVMPEPDFRNLFVRCIKN